VTASYVTLVLDLFDGEGNQLRAGHAVLTPSVALTDVPDMQVIPPASAIADFRPGLTPSVRLLASDNAGPQPAGWAWGIEPAVPGGLDPWSFFAPAGPVSFTATGADPAVFTWVPGDEAWDVLQLPDGTGVQLSGGSLPGGFQQGATYFVTGSTGFAVQLAAYQGGPPLGSLSAGSGELTVVQWQLSALAPVQPVTEMAGYATTVFVTSEVSAAQAAAEAASLPRTGGTVEGELSPTVTALAYSASVAVDATAGNVFSLVMTGACALASPSGGSDGQVIRLRVTSNGHALTYGAAYLFGTAAEPSLSGSGTDILAFEFDAAQPGWCCLGGGGQGFTG
jgi:hypothetical protein